jgi:benzodiazapine receptor
MNLGAELNRWVCRDDIAMGLGLYYLQLGLNFIWTPLFFGRKQVFFCFPCAGCTVCSDYAIQLGLALVDSALLAGSTLYMTVGAFGVKLMMWL